MSGGCNWVSVVITPHAWALGDAAVLRDNPCLMPTTNAAVAVFTMVLAAAAHASAAPRPHPLPRRPLVTPWPASTDCRDFQAVDVSVDDRVEAVEWRGPDGATVVVPVKLAANRDDAFERFRKGSGALDYFGVWQTSQILFPDVLRPSIDIYAAHGSRLLPLDFKAGRLDTLVVRPRAGAGTRPPDSSAGFGLRVVLHCADSSRTGLAWACDDRSCGLRSFRDGPRADRRGITIDGPYQRRWNKGERRGDRARLVCARSDGYEDAARRARRQDENIVCERPARLGELRAPLIEMTRDLLAELDLVLEQGCAGRCSPRIDQLRALAAALRSEPSLRLLGARARFVPMWDLLDWPATLGWVARIGGGPAELELACANHYVESSAAPPVPSCRLTVLRRGVRLADYFPDHRQEVELPDGGAVHLQGSNTEFRNDLYDQKVVIFGSALAMPGDPVPLAKLRRLDVELDARHGDAVVRMVAPDYDSGRLFGRACVRPAARVKATFNGRPLRRATGIYQGGDLQYNRDCMLELMLPEPAARGAAPQSGAAAIAIEEGDTRYRLDVPDALVARQLTLVAPADGVLRPGQPATLSWQPGSDDISHAAIGLRRAGSIAVEETLVIGAKDVSVHGDRIDFTVPARVPAHLHGSIEILFLGTANVKPKVGPCPVDECHVEVRFDVPPAPARFP